MHIISKNDIEVRKQEYKYNFYNKLYKLYKTSLSIRETIKQNVTIGHTSESLTGKNT